MAVLVIPLLLILLGIRAFLYQPFDIPSGSNLPTLRVGDYLFVSKYAYGYSRYSFPFSFPSFHGRIFGKQPERGDVVVFKLPLDNRTDYVKRVIGLPGDHIQIKHGVVVIDGKEVPRTRISDFVNRDAYGNINHLPRYRETLPNGVSYAVLDTQYDSQSDNTGVYNVPSGHYFMMGDNRDNSTDSRMPAVMGYVPYDNLLGRVAIVFFNSESARYTFRKVE